MWHLPKRLAEGGPAYPLWLFLLETTAKAVLFTWVFNGTGGSLLTVSLLHSSVNTSTVFLPIVPTGDTFRPYAFSVGLFCLAAVTVIVLTRGRLLSRQPDGPLRGVPDPARAACRSPGRSVSVVVRTRRAQLRFHGRSFTRRPCGAPTGSATPAHGTPTGFGTTRP